MSSKPLLPKTNPPSSPSTTQVEPKVRGANRSTKTAGKLKVLPDQPTLPAPATRPPEPDESPNATGDTDEGDDEEEEADDDDDEGAEGRLRQISRIPQGTARRDALRLTKKKAKSLPRVTAYATAQCVLLPLPRVRVGFGFPSIDSGVIQVVLASRTREVLQCETCCVPDGCKDHRRRGLHPVCLRAVE